MPSESGTELLGPIYNPGTVGIENDSLGTVSDGNDNLGTVDDGNGNLGTVADGNNSSGTIGDGNDDLGTVNLTLTLTLTSPMNIARRYPDGNLAKVSHSDDSIPNPNHKPKP